MKSTLAHSSSGYSSSGYPSVVFFGTSDFSVRILESLLSHRVPILAIVTRMDKKQGRSLVLQAPPVKQYVEAKALSIPLYQPEKASSADFVHLLAQFGADLFVVVAYGEILKQSVLDIPKQGCINIHASLLPYYRGAAPIQRVLFQGEKETGITIQEMVLKMDAGDILAQEKCAIPEDMNFGELKNKLSEMGASLLIEVLKNYPSYQQHKQKQDETLASLAPKPSLHEEKIDWNRPAAEVHNQIRALSPTPGAWAFFEQGDGQKGGQEGGQEGEKHSPIPANIPARKRIKILKSQPITLPITNSPENPSLKNPAPPGASVHSKNFIVQCAPGTLELLAVQLEGKRIMPGSEFLRGIKGSFSLS